MSTQPNCDDYDPNSLLMEEALIRIEQTVTPVSGKENVSVTDALARVLAEDVLSPINVPAYTNSAMDGYAVSKNEIPKTGSKQLKVIAKVFAGHPFSQKIGRGECVKIMTGAAMPADVDTVIMQEHVTVEGDHIIIQAGHKPEQNVRHAGEDLAKGGVAIATGKNITPADIGLIASLGIPHISVYRKVKVAFFSTGDELKSLGDTLAAGQIYDSNRYTIAAMLRKLGLEIIDLGIIPDNRELIQKAFDEAAKNADVVITTGGVSVGEADFVKEMLEKLGEVNFWKIAMKPGRPLTFGRIQNTIFFGLPGNPVSAMVTFYQFVQPALHKIMGQSTISPTTIKLNCASKLKKSPGRVEFQRGIIFKTENHEWQVKSSGHQGSHILSSMSQANCFIKLPLEKGNIEIGEEVEVQPFAGLL